MMRVTGLAGAVVLCLGTSLHAENRRPSAELDRLAASLREACVVLTTTPSDGTRIAARLGRVVSLLDKRITLEPRQIEFATVSVEDALSFPRAAVTFTLRRPPDVTTADLEKRMGAAAEPEETGFVKPRFLRLPEDATTLGPSSDGHPIEIDMHFKSLKGAGKSECTMTAYVLEVSPKHSEDPIIRITLTAVLRGIQAK
jgi:hypothetical protein